MAGSGRVGGAGGVFAGRANAFATVETSWGFFLGMERVGRRRGFWEADGERMRVGRVGLSDVPLGEASRSARGKASLASDMEECGEGSEIQEHG